MDISAALVYGPYSLGRTFMFLTFLCLHECSGWRHYVSRMFANPCTSPRLRAWM